tara:strand:+ start:232 stop:543 length:312 start_codon:yes stop_codon:yes gene_type:complete
MIRAFIIVFAIVAFGDLMHRAVFWVNFVQPVKTIFADIIGNVAKFIITEKKKVESHQETETKNKKQKTKNKKQKTKPIRFLKNATKTSHATDRTGVLQRGPLT